MRQEKQSSSILTFLFWILFRNLTPVSYTHLDVYKRQAAAYEDVCEENGEPASLSGFLEEVALVADIDSLDEDQDYVIPVSYTHLDVYKRQDRTRTKMKYKN